MSTTEPAWLTAKADQLLARMEQHLDTSSMPISDSVFIMVQLTEPAPNATAAEIAAWDRSCDACGKVCIDTDFWTGHTLRKTKTGHRVHIQFGACANHKA